MVSTRVLGTLLRKNLIVMRAHRFKYIAIYLSPLLILALLLVIQRWTIANFTWVNANPPEYSLPPIPRCSGQHCLTIGYIIQGDRQPYIDSVLAYLKSANGLREEDVMEMEMGAGKIMDYLGEHPNKTQTVLVFCTSGSWQLGDYSVPCFAQEMHLNFYTIIYNMSLFHKIPYFGNLKDSYPKDLVTLRIKNDIDTAIIQHYRPGTTISTRIAEFPSKTSRFVEGVSIVAQNGSFFFILPYLILLILESSHYMQEKEKRLRIGMNIVGVSHLEYYTSELITYAMSVSLITLNFCLSGYALDVKFFSNGLLWFDFVLLWANGMVLGLLAFLITACVSERNLGMSLVYSLVLYTIVMQWLFTGGLLIQKLYMDSSGALIVLFRYVFNLSPSFHFSKIFTDIVRKADSHIDTYQNRFVEGKGFYFQDLFTRVEMHYQKPIPQGFVLPSAFESFMYLALTSLIYLALIALFDRIVESNRGYSSPLCKNMRRRRNSRYEESDRNEGDLVQITNLQKVYGGGVYALNGISLSLMNNEIVALLGENGAGKSTMINILIGALAKSGGQVLILGESVDNDIQKIRHIIGVCPQFDILWEQLTAEEHIRMFLQLKGIQSSEEAVATSLNSVDLLKNRKGKVSTFSGGMRRRMSLAISLLGSPKLVILDEPTTGMDAKIRLLTWQLILNLRKHCTVLLTTHNMEEAECVSDRIMIMVKGRIIASGSSVALKQQFGQGYTIRGYDREKKEEVILRCKQSELEDMLEQIGKKGLQNWSLHETTLEEVFLKATQHY